MKASNQCKSPNRVTHDFGFKTIFGKPIDALYLSPIEATHLQTTGGNSDILLAWNGSTKVDRLKERIADHV